MAYPLILASQMVYTHVKHRNAPALPLASNAQSKQHALPPPEYDTAVGTNAISPGRISHSRSDSGASSTTSPFVTTPTSSHAPSLPDYNEATGRDVGGEKSPFFAAEDEFAAEKLLAGETAQEVSSDRSLSSYSLVSPIAVFPQYLDSASGSTTLTIRELSSGCCSSSSNTFSITTVNADNVPVGSSVTRNELFRVTRSRKGGMRQQVLVDASMNEPILAVRMSFATKPRSYYLEDAAGHKVVDIFGQFARPSSGTRSAVHFTNHVDGRPVELTVAGGRRPQSAVIEDRATGQILARITCDAWGASRSGCGCSGDRRGDTYTVTVRSGVDLALVSGLVIAMHSRSC